MATAALKRELEESDDNLAELVKQLGDIPLERIRIKPPLGTATEADLLAAMEAPRKRICELVDGVLVEKALGTREAMLAVLIAHWLLEYLQEHDRGVVLGADGSLRLRLGLVRIPDVCFISWERMPGEELPDDPIASLIPDLAVEVLSKSNTRKEMARKLRDYFQAGVRLVWLVQPRTQTVEVYTSPTRFQRVGKNQSLDGGEVLPGFSLPLRQLVAPPRRKTRK